MSLREDIESRIQILDIVNRYVQTKKAGVNYKWLCPFHNEKSPSFIISPQKNIAHCFSCGKGGGPIKFLMEIEKIEFREAASILAKEAGIELKTNFASDQKEKWGDIYALYRSVAAWYHDALFLEENKHALQYLLDRGLTEETIKKFQLGYSNNPRDLLFSLKNSGFEMQFLYDSGIFVSEGRDKFFGRITYPLSNSMGHVVAFTGRVLTDALPKYLNSAASQIFDKSSLLYGFHLGKQTIAKTGEVYIVEWQMDTITLHQAGIENAVGISGTALTKDHIRLIKRFASIVYLSLDRDDAGIKATFASIENLLNEDLEIRIIQIPWGKDPDEFIKNGGDYSVLKASALSVVDFYLEEWSREYDVNTIIGKKKLTEKCLEVIARLKSDIEMDFYMQQIIKKLGVSRESLYTEYRKIKTKVFHGQYDNKRNFKNEWTEEIVQNTFSPTIGDLIAAYIYRYQFLDLFFREFRYTHSDLTEIEGMVLLEKMINSNLGESEREYLHILDLSLEETHADSTKDFIEKSFRDFVKRLHTLLFEKERERRLSGINSEDPQFLVIQSELIQKAKLIGLK
jgi:DNA primase